MFSRLKINLMNFLSFHLYFQINLETIENPWYLNFKFCEIKYSKFEVSKVAKMQGIRQIKNFTGYLQFLLKNILIQI